eukprot:jgi/Psemu1/32968/gm1.32968_g
MREPLRNKRWTYAGMIQPTVQDWFTGISVGTKSDEQEGRGSENLALADFASDLQRRELEWKNVKSYPYDAFSEFRTPEQLQYKSWCRKSHDKTSFTPLKNNSRFEHWVIGFKAKLKAHDIDTAMFLDESKLATCRTTRIHARPLHQAMRLLLGSNAGSLQKGSFLIMRGSKLLSLYPDFNVASIEESLSPKLVFNECPYTGRHASILASGQMESYFAQVDDTSIKAGGGQIITTTDEYAMLPHVIMTSDKHWNPSVLATTINPKEEAFLQKYPPQLQQLPYSNYDEYGNPRCLEGLDIKKVLDYLKMLWIGLWQSEAYHQHQNQYECRYQTFKCIVNPVMDRTGTPPHLWLLYPTLSDKQPIFIATGTIGDISAYTSFFWFEPVYFKTNNSPFGSKSTERLGHFLGIAEYVGNGLCFKIWDPVTNKLLNCSGVRSVLTLESRNKRAGLFTDDDFVAWQKAKDSAIKSYTLGDALMTVFRICHPRLPSFLYKKVDNSLSWSPSPLPNNYGEIFDGPPMTHIFSKTPDGVHLTEDNFNPPEFNYFDVSDVTTPHLDPATPTVDTSEVVVTDKEGNAQFDGNGQPITILAIPIDDLQGRSFLMTNPDGTQKRLTIVDVEDTILPCATLSDIPMFQY